jgi:hypothetical protein
MNEAVLRIIRLRLRGWLKPVHVLRLAGGEEVHGFAGSEPIAVDDGRVIAAHSRHLLLSANEERHLLQARPVASVRVLDARRCRRAVARPHTQWTSMTRGTLVEVDDLLFDAAASLNDATAAKRVKDPAGFHGLYAFVWGDTGEPPPLPQRLWLWDEQLDWLQRHLHVLDAHRR